MREEFDCFYCGIRPDELPHKKLYDADGKGVPVCDFCMKLIPTTWCEKCNRRFVPEEFGKGEWCGECEEAEVKQ